MRIVIRNMILKVCNIANLYRGFLQQRYFRLIDTFDYFYINHEIMCFIQNMQKCTLLICYLERTPSYINCVLGLTFQLYYNGGPWCSHSCTFNIFLINENNGMHTLNAINCYTQFLNIICIILELNTLHFIEVKLY